MIALRCFTLVLVMILGGACSSATQPSPSPTAPESLTRPAPATSSPSPAPTDTPSATSPSPQVRPTAALTPTHAAIDWIGPERVATDSSIDAYLGIAIAADDSGDAHIVAGSHDGIAYITNSGGRWRSELISTAQAGGYDGEPAIAIDRDGSLTVVFARFGVWECEPYGCGPGDPLGIGMVTRGSSAWSMPSTVVNGPAYQPSVAVDDGATHVAYQLSGRRRQGIYYAQQSDVAWTTRAIAAEGSRPSIQLASDGTPRLAFVQYDMDTGDFTLLYAIGSPDSNSFAVEVGPALRAYSSPLYNSILDSDDRLHLIGANESGVSQYWTFHDGVWTEPVSIFDSGDGVLAGGIGVGRDGVVHVVSDADNRDQLADGLWYAAGRDGEFISEVIWPHVVTGYVHGPPSRQAIAVDGLARPHVAFTMFADDGDATRVELWYAGGNAP